MNEPDPATDLMLLYELLGHELSDEVDPEIAAANDGGDLPPPDPAVIAELYAAVQAMCDDGWRTMLAEARAAKPAAPRRRYDADRTEPDLLARLAVLAARHPTIAAHYRHHQGMSAEQLRALVEDLEEAAGDESDDADE